jgi:hypothetical protein
MSEPIDITDIVNNKKMVLIDQWKVWNPKPLPLNDTDYQFIVAHLKEWFSSHTKLDGTAINALGSLSAYSIRSSMKYVFTHFSIDEEDVYLIRLKYNDSTYRVYVGKRGSYINVDIQAVEKNKLMYPFYDEEWNRNFYKTDEEYLRMRKLEEDGYNKHFSN